MTVSAVLVAAAFIVGIAASLGVVLGRGGVGARLRWCREVMLLLRLGRLAGLGSGARFGLGPGLVLVLRGRTWFRLGPGLVLLRARLGLILLRGRARLRLGLRCWTRLDGLWGRVNLGRA
jgi:hypothetical protein